MRRRAWTPRPIHHRSTTACRSSPLPKDDTTMQRRSSHTSSPDGSRRCGRTQRHCKPLTTSTRFSPQARRSTVKRCSHALSPTCRNANSRSRFSQLCSQKRKTIATPGSFVDSANSRRNVWKMLVHRWNAPTLSIRRRQKFHTSSVGPMRDSATIPQQSHRSRTPSRMDSNHAPMRGVYSPLKLSRAATRLVHSKNWIL